MLTMTGPHHVSLPAAGVVRSSDWHERVLGLVPLLMAEGEDVVTLTAMEHQCHVLPCGWRQGRSPRAMTEGATVSFLADSQDDLISWDLRLTEPGAGHPGPRDAHLGWALDITGPDGLHIELHTHEEPSADG